MTRRTALLIAIIVLAAALRFYSLGSKPLWLDEIMSAQRVRGSFGLMLDEVAQHDGHPPLYYATQYAAKIFGHGEFAVRIPAALAGLLLVYVVYRAGRLLLGDACGLAAAGLCALSGFQVCYSQEARPYALAMLLAATSLWLLLSILRQNEEKKVLERGLEKTFFKKLAPALPWLAYTLVGAAMLYTFYYLAFALIAEGAILLASRRHSKPIVKKWLISRAVVAVLFAPYLTVVLGRMAGLPPMPTQSKLDVLCALPGAFVQMLTGIDVAALQSPAAVAVVYAAAVVPLLAALVLLRKQFFECSVPLFYVAIAAAGAVLIPWRLQLFEAKHLAFAAPVLLVLAAYLPARFPRPAAWLGFGLLILFNAYSLAGYYDREFQKERWPEACRMVHENVRPGDGIVFNPSYLGCAFAYYYQNAGELIRVDAPALLPAAPEIKRVWLIEERGSNIAPSDPALPALIEKDFSPAEFAFGYGEKATATILPGYMGSIVIKLYARGRP